jgi:two-component system OmpR family sensor kinase/two-component system sensor histidine kinase BaeS
MGVLFAVCLVLTAIGLTTVVSWLLPSDGATVPVRPPRIFFGLLWLFVLLALFRGLMGRFGFPLGAMVEAADRVAAGDYSTRAPEHGPRWMRTLARAFNSMTSRLEVQDRQRRDLMADIAHELRTPLAVLQGRLEGMVDGIYPRDEGQLAAVLQETRMLARLVEDLRTLAHTESGTLTLQKESTDLAILLNDTAASFAAEAAERKIRLEVEAPASLPLIDIDPVRIREVLTNLISNALRHTSESGRVSVTASAQGDTVVVTVSDNGRGIPAEDLLRIFDRFYKGHGSRGSGLGLTIARNLVVAHGGEIRAESEEGKGTTMRIILTLQPQPPRQS